MIVPKTAKFKAIFMLNNMSILPHDDSIIVKDITKKTRYIQLMKKLLKEFQQALFFFENK